MARNQTVNVKEIAEKAEISRGTFYAHYEGLDSMTVEMAVEDLGNEPFSLRMLVEKYAERRSPYRQILAASNSRTVLEAMVDATCDALLISCAESTLERDKLERLARFTAWGYIGMLDTWLREIDPVSPEELADFLRSSTPPDLLPDPRRDPAS